MRTIWTLIAIFMLVTIGDAYTTWACLRSPVPGVFEANPIAHWMFGYFGLLPGLIIDGVITLLTLVWIGCTKRIRAKLKLFILILGVAITSWAVYHNYGIMIELGLA
jgi:hypothetical protein